MFDVKRGKLTINGKTFKMEDVSMVVSSHNKDEFAINVLNYTTEVKAMTFESKQEMEDAIKTIYKLMKHRSYRNFALVDYDLINMEHVKDVSGSGAKDKCFLHVNYGNVAVLLHRQTPNKVQKSIQSFNKQQDKYLSKTLLQK